MGRGSWVPPLLQGEAIAYTQRVDEHEERGRFPHTGRMYKAHQQETGVNQWRHSRRRTLSPVPTDRVAPLLFQLCKEQKQMPRNNICNANVIKTKNSIPKRSDAIPNHHSETKGLLSPQNRKFYHFSAFDYI